MREPNAVTAAAKASGEPHFREIGVGPWSQAHPDEPRPDQPESPNYERRYASQLLDEGDRRNVLDRYRYWSVEAIREDLDTRGRFGYEIAVENWTHDFNIGSMVRTANALAAQSVHIVGPHKWNRKGALMTELYSHVEHHPSIEELAAAWQAKLGREVAAAEAAGNTLEANDAREARMIALDIVPGAVPIERYRFPSRCLMLFGAEGPGLSKKALELADDVVYISQFGSVRSINAGAAAAIAMHCWVAQHTSCAGGLL